MLKFLHRASVPWRSSKAGSRVDYQTTLLDPADLQPFLWIHLKKQNLGTVPAGDTGRFIKVPYKGVLETPNTLYKTASSRILVTTAFTIA